MTANTTAVASVRQLRQALAPRAAGVVYALIALVSVLTITSSVEGRPNYLSAVNVSNVLDQSSLAAILAIFTTIVLITGNFDLSIASTAALSGTVALEMVDQYGPVVAVLAALAAGAAVGVVNAVLVQKVGVNAFIVTLGTLTAVRGVVQAILDGQSITATNTTFENFETARRTLPEPVAIGLGVVLVATAVLIVIRAGVAGRLMLVLAVGVFGLVLLGISLLDAALLTETTPVWLMLILAVIVSAVLRFTVVGRNIYAVGGNPEAARLSGISVDRYKMSAFIVNGIVAGAVGVLYAGKFNSVDPTVLTGEELTVIAAAVLGGTSLFGGSGYVAKSVAGTLILFTLSNGFNVLNIGSNYQNVVQGSVLIAAASLYTATSSRGRGFLRQRWDRARGGRDQASGQPPTAPQAGLVDPHVALRSVGGTSG
jgi:D-xylose transport system permease protein